MYYIPWKKKTYILSLRVCLQCTICILTCLTLSTSSMCTWKFVPVCNSLCYWSHEQNLIYTFIRKAFEMMWSPAETNMLVFFNMHFILHFKTKTRKWATWLYPHSILFKTNPLLVVNKKNLHCNLADTVYYWN